MCKLVYQLDNKQSCQIINYHLFWISFLFYFGWSAFILCVLQGGGGQWTLNYNGTQSLITTLSYSLAKKLWIL